MSKKSDYVQCDLKSLLTGNKTTMWLDRSEEFKVGSIISLKGESERWHVLRKGTERKQKGMLNTDWAVGGLKKRKKT
jgi:hypothetical protein